MLIYNILPPEPKYFYIFEHFKLENINFWGIPYFLEKSPLKIGIKSLLSPSSNNVFIGYLPHFGDQPNTVQLPLYEVQGTCIFLRYNRIFVISG